MPLLDTTADIERPSQLWAVDPVSDYDLDDTSSIPTAQIIEYLKRSEQKPPEKRLNVLESAVLINLAMCLYTATISFAKGMVMSKGINIASLPFLGFGSMYLFHQLKAMLARCTSQPGKRSLNPRLSTPTPRFYRKSESCSPQGGHNDTNYSQKLEDLHGDPNGDSLFFRTISDSSRSFFAFLAVLTLLAAVALLPCSLVLLIVAQGEMVTRFA